MKSKYTKIFMIFAVVFAMFAALFISPNIAFAEGEEEQTSYTVLTEADLESDSLDAKIKHDLKAIIASTPDTAYISFPLTYKSAYKNEITWGVQEDAVAIKYDSIGNWMIVNRSAETSYTETIYVIINNTYQYNFEISIPKGITYAPSYNINYFDGENELTLEKDSYTLGEETFALAEYEKEGYEFAGWYTNPEFTGDKVDQVVVGSMTELNLYAKFEAKEFTLTFMNGEEVVQETKVAYGTEVTYPTLEPKNGFTLTWDKEITTMPAEDTVINAVWTPNKYKLTFVYDETTEETEVTFGDTVTYPSVEPKNGYTLTWDKEITTMPAEDTTITASWDLNTYTITYYINGALVENLTPTTFTVEDEVVLPEPTQTGYDFNGWYLDSEYTTSYNSFSGRYENLTVYGKFELKTGFELSFDVDGGSAVSPVPGAFGEEVTLGSSEKTGYKFTGWKSEDGTVYQAGDTYVFGEQGETLTAQWEAVSYTITYEGLENETHENPGTYTIESEKIVLADPTLRDHYTFIGWFDAEGNEVEEIATGTTGNLELTAQWEAVSYTITYSGLEGATHENPLTYTVETGLISLKDPTEREHYEFAGWFKGEEKVTEIASGSTGNIELTATWTPKEYTVVFNNVDGSKINEVKANYGSEIAEPEKPSMNGYEFVEWTINGEKVTFPLTVSSSDMVLTAKFVTIEYTITYVLNNGTNNESNPASYTIETATITLVDPTKHGYEFKGWYDAEGNKITEIATGSTGDLTLTAEWEILPLQEYVNEDAAALALDYPLLTGSFFTSPYSNLATTGDKGSTILWSSSSAAFYVQNDGTVVVTNVLEEESEVVLTATVQYVDSETGTAYVKNVEFTFVVKGIYELVDEETKVKVSNVPGEHTLTVIQVTESTGGFSLANGETLLVAYDIKFDGQESTTFEQEVTVLMPLPVGFTSEEEVVLYHFKGEQQETVDYDVVTVDGTQYIQFTADSFSPYVIAKVVTIVTINPDSIDFSTAGYANTENLTTVELTNSTLTFSKGNGSTNPAYYASGTAARLYAKNTLTISSSKTISKVVFGYGSSDGSNEITVDLGTFTTDTWEGSENSIVFTFGANETSGNRRIQTITIYYADGSTEEPETPAHEHTACETCGLCTAEDCDGEETEKCQGHESEVPTHEHTACETCGLCTAEDCDGEESVKCQGHTTEPETPTEGSYTLVTDISQLTAGSKIVIVAKEYDYALSTTQNSNNRGQAAVTKTGETVSFGNDVQVLTLEVGYQDGTWAFNTGSGYLYAASSSKNYLRTETTLSDNSSWTIEFAADGTATITAQGSNTRNLLKYNKSSSIFAAYASGQQDIVIYIYK